MDPKEFMEYLCNNSEIIGDICKTIEKHDFQDNNALLSLEKDIEEQLGDKLYITSGLVIFLIFKEETLCRQILNLDGLVKRDEIINLFIDFNINFNQEQFDIICKKINSFLSSKVKSDILMELLFNIYDDTARNIEKLNSVFREECKEKKIKIPKGIKQIYLNQLLCVVNRKLKRIITISFSLLGDLSFAINGKETQNYNYIDAKDAEFLADLKNK